MHQQSINSLTLFFNVNTFVYSVLYTKLKDISKWSRNIAPTSDNGFNYTCVPHCTSSSPSISVWNPNRYAYIQHITQRCDMKSVIMFNVCLLLVDMLVCWCVVCCMLYVVSLLMFLGVVRPEGQSWIEKAYLSLFPLSSKWEAEGQIELGILQDHFVRKIKMGEVVG